MLKKILNVFGILFVSFSIIGGTSCIVSSCSKHKETISRQEATNRALKSYIIELTDSINVLHNDLNSSNEEVEFWKTTFEDAKYSLEESASYRDSFEYLKEDLFVYKYKLERIKAYNAIVERDATQSVFFRGWVKRVLED